LLIHRNAADNHLKTRGFPRFPVAQAGDEGKA
jgi:hypothetical protein